MFQFALVPALTIILFFGGVYTFQATNTVSQPTPELRQMKPDQTAPEKSSANQIVRDFNPVFGKENATVTVVEFADFQCPGCKAMNPVVAQIKEEYKDRVKFVFKVFPLPIHNNAQSAAQSALAAAKQGKYFEYADRLYSSQEEPGISPENQLQIAKDLNLNIEQWQQDRDSKEVKSEVSLDFNDGRTASIPSKLGPTQFSSVDSTPTFVFIKDGKVLYKKNGISSDEFRANLDELLK
jgi:thiol-disulfide isomerase/thioredoxin